MIDEPVKMVEAQPLTIEYALTRPEILRSFVRCAVGSPKFLATILTYAVESVFVLESFYQRARPDIAEVLKGLITSPGIEIGKQTIHLDALDRYERTKIHFVDCLLAATAAAEDTPVASFDQDFREFADVRVETQ